MTDRTPDLSVYLNLMTVRELCVMLCRPSPYDHLDRVVAEFERRCSLPPPPPADELLAACRYARELYDQLAYGPLDGAAHFGPDWSPPTNDDMLRVRGRLESAILKAESVKVDPPADAEAIRLAERLEAQVGVLVSGREMDIEFRAAAAAIRRLAGRGG